MKSAGGWKVAKLTAEALYTQSSSFRQLYLAADLLRDARRTYIGTYVRSLRTPQKLHAFFISLCRKSLKCLLLIVSCFRLKCTKYNGAKTGSYMQYRRKKLSTNFTELELD